MKSINDEIASMYIDSRIAFALEDFRKYYDMLLLKHPFLCLKWKELFSNLVVSCTCTLSFIRKPKIFIFDI